MAKAVSHDGSDLELVLYPGSDKKVVSLHVKQLEPGIKYVFGEKDSFTADTRGEAAFLATLQGRTQIYITRA